MYIHRSGRTGRAGQTGASMLFYKSQQEHMIPLVERKAGVQFQRIGAPQPVDIIKAGQGIGIDQVCVMCKEIRRPLPMTLSTFTCVHVRLNDPLPYVNP